MSPLILRPGLQVLLQSHNYKMWDIEGEVMNICLGGVSSVCPLQRCKLLEDKEDGVIMAAMDYLLEYQILYYFMV